MSKLIRKKRGASGGWRVHTDDLRTACQLLACGMIRRGRLASPDSAERFVDLGFAVCHAGLFALTGRGIIAALLSGAVWAEAIRKRRLAKSRREIWDRLPPLYPFVAPRSWLDDAIGRPTSRPIPPEVALAGVPANVVRALMPPSPWAGTDVDLGDLLGHRDVGHRGMGDRLFDRRVSRDERERYPSEGELAAEIEAALAAADFIPPSRSFAPPALRPTAG